VARSGTPGSFSKNRTR